VRTVVGPVHDEGVVGDAEVIQSLEDRADIFVVIDHGIVAGALETSRLADALRLGMRAEVHVGEVYPDEERLTGIFLALEVGSPTAMSSSTASMRCLVRGPVSLHYLLAHLSEAWINRWVVLIRDLAVHDAARPILCQKRERGKIYDVTLVAGSRSVTAKALAETKSVTVALADRSLNERMRTANTLEVKGEGATLRVPLDGSTAALGRLETCFEKNSNASVESNPFVAPGRKP
jgi:hypothetical protein